MSSGNQVSFSSLGSSRFATRPLVVYTRASLREILSTPIRILRALPTRLLGLQSNLCRAGTRVCGEPQKAESGICGEQLDCAGDFILFLVALVWGI